MAEKNETYSERITRNWHELLQELRVVQTGVQILTGFLLTVPFTNRFTALSSSGRIVYLLVLLGAIGATALLVAPVALHRMLFRQRQRPWLVKMAHRCALGGLALLALASCGAAYVVFTLAASTSLAIVIAALLIGLFLALWCALPLWDRMRRGRSAKGGS